MLSEQDAILIAKQGFPADAKINAPVSYKDLYIFKIFYGDELEQEFDPFYSVNQHTGELRDYSPITDGDITELTALFLRQT